MKTFAYKVEGTDGNRNPYTVEGTVTSSFPLLSPELNNEVGRDSFQKLTQGKAVFGRPGEGGCRGPYTIDRLVIEVVKA
jgi:hypothetical protein